jgi:hypothetical protein
VELPGGCGSKAPTTRATANNEMVVSRFQNCNMPVAHRVIHEPFHLANSVPNGLGPKAKAASTPPVSEIFHVRAEVASSSVRVVNVGTAGHALHPGPPESSLDDVCALQMKTNPGALTV